ncbi:MAG: hypothetical protein H7Y86_21455 [Rhizobacter sp.]|nr:hypothetical protein [Ferruginibacter sp.]
MRLIFTLVLLSLAGNSICQTLTLNPGYGNMGIAVTNFSNNAPHFTFATGKQSGEKMIIGGSSLIRVLSNGDVDSSFGSNGMAIKAGFPEINTLAVQADDKIIAAFYDYSQVLIKRFTLEGSIDSSFNTTGMAVLSEQGKVIYISKIRLQQDGKILLAGNALANEKTSFFIARYLTDGTPDSSFNNTGYLTLGISAGDNVAYDIAEQSTGKLIVGGSAKTGIPGNSFLALIRLNTDGSRDMSFNTTGLVQYSVTGETGHLLHIYNDDKILVAGTTGDQLLLMRLLAEGNADLNFSSDGLLIEPGPGAVLAKEIAVLGDSSIVVTGQASVISPFNWEYAAFKFDNSGNPDSGFNGTGQTFLPFPNNDFNAGSIVLNDGSILMGGFNDTAVFANTAVISSSGIFDINHGTNGIKSLQINGTDETIYTILKQADNKLVAIGNKTDALASFYDNVVVRYNGDGTIDSSFANNGILYIAEPGFVFHSAILQPDGKILVSGDKYVDDPGVEPGICVIRINNDGTPDSGFGNNAVSMAGSGSTSGNGKGIGLLSDGKIMLAGKDPVNADLIVLFRLLGNGMIDNSFAEDGKKTIDPGFAENGLGTLIIQPDDKILLGGYIVQGNGQSSFYCMRLQTNGDTDAAFASGGIYRTTPSAIEFIELNSIVVTPADKILLTGHIISASDRSGSVCIIRLLPGGALDNTFNGTGLKTYYKKLNNDSTFIIPNAVAIHPDSSIYIIGDAFNNNADHERFIIRIKQNGVLDSTISTEGSGWYNINHRGLDGTVNDLVVNADSSIFIAGNRDAVGTNNDFLIAAYKRLPDIQGIVYVFNGNGLWTDAANWLDNLVPPATLPNGAMIIVDPIPAGSSILNIEQNITPGGKFVVRPGKKLLIQNNFKIGN